MYVNERSSRTWLPLIIFLQQFSDFVFYSSVDSFLILHLRIIETTTNNNRTKMVCFCKDFHLINIDSKLYDHLVDPFSLPSAQAIFVSVIMVCIFLCSLQWIGERIQYDIIDDDLESLKMGFWFFVFRCAWVIAEVDGLIFFYFIWIYNQSI